tara:strand:- start:295 stop:816 length:522 start_codon:yes stop_codon:yes gene_type:complete
MHSFILFSLLLVISCSRQEKNKNLQSIDKKEFNDRLILSHQAFLEKEKGRIDYYIDSLGFPFEKTGTGLRYYIEEKNEGGDSLKIGDVAVIDYKLTSIYGDSLYETVEGLAQEFMVGYDQVESGLHEGIQFMHVGERAIFILPAHLAHGITGDQAAIRSQTTLVYKVHLLAKK